MIRSGIEYRNAKRQIEDLRSELNRLTPAESDEVSRGVISALEMKISDIEHEIDEYENLKKGHVSEFNVKSLDEFGEVVTKARIARGWNQTELARALDMKSPQIARYESNDWQKISLWRLQEVVETLGLDVAIHARLRGHEEQDIEPLQAIFSYGGSYPGMISSLGLGVGEKLCNFGVGTGDVLGNVGVNIGEALSGVGMGISEVLGTLPTTISDAVYGSTQPTLGVEYRTSQLLPNVPQMMPEKEWSPVPESGTLEKSKYRPPRSTGKLPELKNAA